MNDDEADVDYYIDDADLLDEPQADQPTDK